MGKQNTKAGATQIKQDMAAAAAAETQLQQQEEQQPNSAPLQDAIGVADGAANTGAEDQQPSEDNSATQEQAETASQVDKDIVIEPIAVAAPVAPAVEKTVVVEAAVPVAANASTNEQLASILKEVPTAHQIDINRIQAYLERMAPKRPVDGKTVVNEQVALYRSIQNIVNRQEQYFTQLFTALLFIFKTEGKTGALSDRYRARGMENITLHAGDRKAFLNITQLLHMLADVKSREVAMGQVNFERALENGLTAEGRKRVLDYFGA